MAEISIRPVETADVEIFYEHQADTGAAQMAAFPSRDHAAHLDHWTKRILGDPNNDARTVLVGGAVAGNVISWPDPELGRMLGYWIGREFWGRGVASEAVRLYLSELPDRPIHAFVAVHNAGSRRVLEKNGFRRASDDPEIAPDGIREFEFVLD